MTHALSSLEAQLDAVGTLAQPGSGAGLSTPPPQPSLRVPKVKEVEGRKLDRRKLRHERFLNSELLSHSKRLILFASTSFKSTLQEGY